MTVSLGIHCGHDSSCAVVVDGRIAAAMQQERKTGRKHDGQECLTNDLPVNEVLELAKVSLNEVDIIVSSFQAAGPGAAGMQRPLVADSFNLFDAHDSRHFGVSHHRAHAASAAFGSGFSQCGVLVSDLAGSTTIDGRDFFLPFAQVENLYYADPGDSFVRTETRSFYRFSNGALTLLERDFAKPHNQPDVYVMSEAALYENMSRFIFRSGNAHGQLMALAGLDDGSRSPVSVDQIVDITRQPAVLLNGWQRLVCGNDPSQHAPLAHVTQDAFSRMLLSQVNRAVELSGCRMLAAAGGVFLNLPANTEIDSLESIDGYYVPSSPHDAGISIGCAFLGSIQLDPRYTPIQITSDFLGPLPSNDSSGLAEVELIQDAQQDAGDLIEAVSSVLCAGELVFRIAGRAEFGPRALGNRSILGHPVHCKNARVVVNQIKGRQPWRPVAPLTLETHCKEFFDGPTSSPFMNMNFRVRQKYSDVLQEVVHADGTARVQTIPDDEQGFIPDLLRFLNDVEELPILLNTSLNGPGQPIINDVSVAVEFARRSGVRYLLTDTGLYNVTPVLRSQLPADAALIKIGSAGGAAVSFQGSTVPIMDQTFRYLSTTFEFDESSFDPADYHRLRTAIDTRGEAAQ